MRWERAVFNSICQGYARSKHVFSGAGSTVHLMGHAPKVCIIYNPVNVQVLCKNGQVMCRQITAEAPPTFGALRRLWTVWQGSSASTFRGWFYARRRRKRICVIGSIYLNASTKIEDARLHWPSHHAASAAQHWPTEPKPVSPLVSSSFIQLSLWDEARHSASWWQTGWSKRCQHAGPHTGFPHILREV